MNSTRALFFDLDGTLCDTHGLCRATWLEVLRPYGIDVDFSFYQRNIRGRPNGEVVQELLPDCSGEARQRVLDAQTDSYRKRMRGAGPLPGLSEFIETSRQTGYRLSLVSNTPAANAPDSLQPLGLEDAFDAQVFPDQAGASKPDPAPYRVALDQLEIDASDGLAFEDSPKGVTAATQARVPVIGLVSTHHPTELRDAGAALVVGDFVDPILYDVLNHPELLDER